MSTLYDTDLATWAEARATLLKARRFDGFDLDHLIGELEACAARMCTDSGSTCAGCLENFSGHRGGHRFQMHPIPEMLNAPGEAIHCVVSSSFIKIVGP